MTVFTNVDQSFQVKTSTADTNAVVEVSTSGTNIRTEHGPFTVRLSTEASPKFGLGAAGTGIFIPTVTSATATTVGIGAYISVTDGAGNSYFIPVRATSF